MNTKDISTGSDIMDFIAVVVVIWMVAFFLFDVQISLRVERVPSEVSVGDAIADTWDKSTTVEDYEEFVEPIDQLIPSNE